MTIEADIKFLKTITMFRAMDPARLKLIALMSERMHYGPGEKIFQQGQKAEAVFFIVSGEIEMYRNSPRARFHAMSLEKGSFFGAAALLTGTPYPTDVSAKGDVVALRISKDLFFELMQSVPEFSLAVAHDLADRIYAITARAFEMADESQTP